ncbi:hypothetical protein GCM10009853_064740 [Glycomyces scopariae]|uniref:Uncharacterized protein n=1 Tax=Glycomyces sambucus TaxID=380244 RepID=A0A1G9HC71_9ACTN|nr:hypothetical protein [Glycomyces sambucus]SDL10560.1 hypothetical protein SAMN05216298_2760 [Glycomyces sambucus]
MTLAPVEPQYAEYEHWLVLNAADQIVTVGRLLEQQVRTLEYLTPDHLGGLAEFEPDLSGIRSNG